MPVNTRRLDNAYVHRQITVRIRQIWVITGLYITGVTAFRLLGKPKNLRLNCDKALFRRPIYEINSGKNIYDAQWPLIWKFNPTRWPLYSFRHAAGSRDLEAIRWCLILTPLQATEYFVTIMGGGYKSFVLKFLRKQNFRSCKSTS